ncbi:MAG TPA: hypothetical protein PKI94_01395 [Candidatus Gastranaerophilaceae bacterium]|nr:hypothetical protein [Candidatus Gastranaerophilaceae bacterium]
MNKRWYDNHDETLQTFDILKKLDRESRKRLANDIVDVANQIKAVHREEDEPSLTIGLERVLGIWQSSNARRWYDKQEDLNTAIKTISTLPEDDFLNIMEGICVSLKE